MENNSSKEYISELLKQLEELKRIKAQKERKLQKLKTSAQVNQQKEQVHRISQASFHKTCNQICVGDSCRVTSDGIYDNIYYKHENCPFDGPEITKKDCAKIEKYKENYSNNSIISTNRDQLNSKKNILKNSETPVCDKGVSERKCVSEKFKSDFLNFGKNDCKRFKKSNGTVSVSPFEKSSNLNDSKEAFFSVNHDLLIQGGDSCCVEKCHLEVNGQNDSVALDVEKTRGDEKKPEELTIESEGNPFSDVSIMRDFNLDNSFCGGSKGDNTLNKSLSDRKDENSDILNDTLNANMRCFLSSEFFSDDDHTQELVFADKSVVKCTSENTKQVETSELIIGSSTVPKKNQQNLGNFNFPKFSTPTDGINFTSSGDENINLLNNSVQQNTFNVSGVKVLSSTTEYICSVSNMCKDDIEAKNIFDPTQVILNIEKGLSPVLDAHYVSLNKPTTSKKDVLPGSENIHSVAKIYKENLSEKNSEHTEQPLCLESSFGSYEYDKDFNIDNGNFESADVFNNHSSSLVESLNYSFGNVQSQVTKTVNGLVNQVCEDTDSASNIHSFKIDTHADSMSRKTTKADSEILVVPETEGLGFYFSKGTEDFLETSTLSENLDDFHTKENLLNVSSQSRLESPVVNKIVAAVRSAKDSSVLSNNVTFQYTGVKDSDMNADAFNENEEKVAAANSDVLGMEISFPDDDTQELGNYKQVPYMNQNDVECTLQFEKETQSNLNFICSLYGASKEAVVDVEITLFGNVKYAFIQHKTEIHVWRQEKKKEWIKIFNHQIENIFSLVKICMTRDENNLVIVMLLSNGEQYCLQFLLFEKDARVIKLMENTHWLEKRHSNESVLLCGLEGLMFASAQPKFGHEVSLHAFISLKDSPRLMTAVLSSTGCTLYSLCKIKNLPNALLGINDSMLYVWHVLEARLVTAVSLHPHDYLPIKWCFWATVENGLIYLLTTCEGSEKHSVCQLLAANLATGFCQTAMKFSSLPSRNEMMEITKAVYMEPFLVVSNSKGVLMWSITDEHCCAALSSKCGTTSVAISNDFENWGLIAVGSKHGYITCYRLN